LFFALLAEGKGREKAMYNELELSLRHLQQMRNEMQKAMEVQERASARLKASIERNRKPENKPTRLIQLDSVQRRLALVRGLKIEIEREIEGLRQTS
jgi:hypothetical protein